MDNNLRKLRKERDLSLREAAKFLEVTKSTLGNYEKGETSTKDDFLERAADFYGVTIPYILKRTKFRNNPNLKIQKAIEDDPELLEFWNLMEEREEFRMMFKQTRKLNKEAIKQLVGFMMQIEKDEGSYRPD